MSQILDMMVEARLDERQMVLDKLYAVINENVYYDEHSSETVSAITLKIAIDNMRRN